jgi:NEDD8-activating enzyme E1
MILPQDSPRRETDERHETRDRKYHRRRKLIFFFILLHPPFLFFLAPSPPFNNMSQGSTKAVGPKPATVPIGSGVHLLCTRKSAYQNETGVVPHALPNGYFEPGEETLTKLAESTILVIGAGGLGCELLKDLALVGFKDIHVIDMDTIDVTNLNRQFLFREKDVGKMKSVVAAEFIQKRDPTVKVTPYTCMIQKKDDAFYKQFSLIVAGLDNIKARQWMNQKLLELCPVDEDGDIDFDEGATLIPMIDGGTEGLNGQVNIIIPRVTKCFNCTMKDVQPTETYQVCTIANEPRTPAHCIIFVKFAIEQRLTSDAALEIVEQWKKLTSVKEDESHSSGGKTSLVSIDNDSPKHMRFICEKAQERALQYNIDPPDYNKTMGKKIYYF